MTKYLTSIPQIIRMMDFISETSTLYEVEPGPEFRLVAANDQAQVSGATPKALFGQLLSTYLPQDFYRETLLPILTQVITDKHPFRGQHVTPYPGGASQMDCLISPIVEDDVCTHVWVITKPIRRDSDLEYLLATDELTGVSNRRFFIERLHKSFKRYSEYGIEFTVMLIDLDNFKAINDSNGHPFGDSLLQAIVKRMSYCVRGNDVIGRLGGDEFLILTEGSGSLETACDIAQRILAEIQQPFNIRNSQLTVSLSIGIAGVRNHESIEDILADADKALYKAKFLGGKQFVVSDGTAPWIRLSPF